LLTVYFQISHLEPNHDQFTCVSQWSPKKLVDIAVPYIFADQVLFLTLLNSFKALPSAYIIFTDLVR